MVCKYHRTQYDAKILPKWPQYATNRCFAKVANDSLFKGVSETRTPLSIDLNVEI